MCIMTPAIVVWSFSLDLVLVWEYCPILAQAGGSPKASLVPRPHPVHARRKGHKSKSLPDRYSKDNYTILYAMGLSHLLLLKSCAITIDSRYLGHIALLGQTQSCQPHDMQPSETYQKEMSEMEVSKSVTCLCGSSTVTINSIIHQWVYKIWWQI